MRNAEGAAMQLWVYLNGAKRGPFSDQLMRRLLADGVLQENDLAATSRDGEWKPLGQTISYSASAPTPLPQDDAVERDTVAGTAEPPIGSVLAGSAAVAAHRPAVPHDSLGDYTRATIAPNETVFYKTSVHWIVFLRYGVLGVLVFFFVAIPFGIAVQAFTGAHLGWFALPLPMLILIPPAVQYSSNELVVTNRRVLIKTGVVHRQTLEMFVSKVESVGVDQSFLGRMLDYGTVMIRGTGGSEEPFQTIAHPIEFRNCVQRLQSEAESELRAT